MLNRRIYLFFLLFSAFLTSCQREIDVDNYAPRITARTEAQSSTRTSLSVDEDGQGTIYWNPADRISVFFGTTRVLYTSQNKADATSAVFQTTDNVTSTTVSSTNIWGLYPSDDASTCDGNSVTTTLPSQQYGIPETFDDDLFITLAHSNSTTLQFYNVCGGIKFSLSRDDIKAISFRGNNNENLAGEVKLSFSNNLPNATVVNGVKEITLTPKTGQTFSKDVNYYIVTLPTTLSNGFTMTFTTTDGAVGTLNYTDKAITLKRSIFSRQKQIDSFATFEGGTQSNNVIYYTTDNGKIVTPYKTDVFGAGIVSNEYVNGQGVLTFDGTVTSIGDYAFFYCTHLTSIVIPDSVTSFGISAFDSCNQLTAFDIPGSVESINDYAFYNCVSLTSIEIPSSVTQLGDRVFSCCTALASITVDSGNPVYDSRNGCNAIIETKSKTLVSGCMNTVIPSSVTSIGKSAFYHLTSLTSIDIPNSVTTIGDHAFFHCSGLKSLVIPYSVTSIEFDAFTGGSGLTSISVNSSNPNYDSRDNCNALIETKSNTLIIGCKNTIIPNTITSIKDSAFADCTGLTSIEIPKSVTSIGDIAFDSCTGLTSITVYATTPPAIGNGVFDNTNDCPIYVPAKSLDLYKSAWSKYSDRILAMDDSQEAVDLGLSVKWAACNLGASSPEEYGDYYAWGETEPYYSGLNPLTWKEKKTGYNWSSYGLIKGSQTSLTKYCLDPSYGYNGFTDFKAVLDQEDDAAYMALGGNWRMPTDAEWTELRVQCTWEWTSMNGIYGQMVTGPNGNSIFLPAAGVLGSSLFFEGSYGTHWSSSLNTDYSDRAWYVDFDSSSVNRTYYDRYVGRSIRPVNAKFITVGSVSLNKTSLSLTEGETATLTATVTPSNATEKTVTWSSSNTSVATVSSSGLVTAVSSGTATISVWSSDGEKSATCEVTVQSKYISVTGITLDNETLTLDVNKTAQLTATVQPSNANNKSVKWSTSSSSIVSVSAQGNVATLTAKSAGEAIITVEAVEGGYTKQCKVTVTIPVSSISLSQTAATIAFGQTLTLTATVQPTNASNSEIEWSSSNPAIASVSDGVVTAGTTSGNVTITAKSKSNPEVTATCKVTVKSEIILVNRITISPSSLNLYLNQTAQLTATVSPSNADDKSIIWSVPQGSVVSVDQNGIVTAVREGTSRVIASSSDGNAQAWITVTVTKNAVTGLALSSTTLTLKVGETYDLQATVYPSDASNSKVNWTTSISAVASVSASGRVTARAAGTATIKATSDDDSSIYKTCTVMVLASGTNTGGAEGIDFEDFNF